MTDQKITTDQKIMADQEILDQTASPQADVRYGLRKGVGTCEMAAELELLNALVEKQKIREIDRSFALFAVQQYPDLAESERLLLVMTAALLSEQLGQQHVCIDLNSIKTKQFFAPVYRFPDVERITALFSMSSLQQEGLFKLVHKRLYLMRYWHYEQQIVTTLSALQAPQFSDADLADCLDTLYPLDSKYPSNYKPPSNGEAVTTANDDAPDWQKAAVALACLKSVAVIAGGPGTGKTTTVVRILWALSQLSQHAGITDPIIKMVAPTGKAAARLSESVSGAVAKLPSQDNNIPLECSTIHRLLGAIPGSVFFRHDSSHPLNIDVLVVDEASMIDMPLLAKLLSALPTHCRIILLGDSHQLASVEVGSVFSDICSLKGGNNRFSQTLSEKLSKLTRQPMLKDYVWADTVGKAEFMDSILYLQKSWRFDANSGVGKLAYAINSGDVEQSLQVLQAGLDDIQWYRTANTADFIRAILPHFERFHAAVTSGDVAQAFNVLAQWQVLAVQRSGKWGTNNLNLQIRQALMRVGLIADEAEFYPGRPIMITSNDYQNRLFNGDIGIVMGENAMQENIVQEIVMQENVMQENVMQENVMQENVMQNKVDRKLLKVWFPDAEQGHRSLLPAQLPSHETLYAMTTHKSQGSEFDNVLMCLPESIPSATGRVNRELLYTGVTRAKKRFVLFSDGQAVSQAIVQQCRRSSGLAQTLSDSR